MKLKETTFNNFRCFTEYRIQFATDATVFIGKNGTGKSSVLSGIRRGLSFMFSKPKNFSKHLSISNNANVRSYRKNEANFDSINRVYNYPINNTFSASFVGEDLDWSMVKKSENGGYLTNRYKGVVDKVIGYYNNDLQAELPVLAVITDSFPHERVNFGKKAKKTVGADILPRDLAYYGWDDRTNCLELWFNRFFKVSDFEKALYHDIRSAESQIELWTNRLKDKAGTVKEEIDATLAKLNERLTYLKSEERSARFIEERAYIETKLIDFTKPISEEFDFVNREFELYRVTIDRVDSKSYTLEFTFKDGRVIPFDNLPMGYKRVFSMVIDIAYRSYILNQGKESHGIVLIDELELHLHPTLQQDILQRLKRIFPNIQFIVTTHSPLVISNFKVDGIKNKIIKLEHEGSHYFNSDVENIFGIDYNTGVSEIMGANYRNTELNKLIDSIVILKNFKQEDKANELRQELLRMVGENNNSIEKLIEKRLMQNGK